MTTDRNRALNAASGAASKRLKEAHQSEWDTLMAEEAALRNEEWAPKPDAKAKAEADFERLLAEYPHLAEKAAATWVPEAP